MQHLDEGTIHAWLDGALAPNEASAAAAHVQSCEQCARVVAEARGLIAASSRILGALDDVPAVPSVHTTTLRRGGGTLRRRSWWSRTGIGYAAAATLLLAAGTTVILRSTGPGALDEPAAVAATDAGSERRGVAAEQAAPTANQPEGKAAAQSAREAELGAAGAASAASAKKVQENPKEELAIDRVEPLPGAMPRPVAPSAAPPPAVRQDFARSNLADAAKAAPERGAVVQGRVLDAATGAPVAGATVSVDTTRVATRTDSMGRFQLEQVPLGRQTVSVRALGFQQAQHQLAVQAADSTQLGFALQKAAEPLAAVVTGQAQPLREESRRRAVNLEAVAANAAGILGCYDLRVISGARDSDNSLAGLPSRIELEARAAARARREEPIVNRARKVAGDGDVESWRFVGDSLELTLLANERTRVLRFARDNARWVRENAVLERCVTRPNE